jgi:hypothetical protein
VGGGGERVLKVGRTEVIVNWKGCIVDGGGCVLNGRIYFFSIQ